MSALGLSDLPAEAVGLQLFRITGKGTSERTIACEAMRFARGYPAVDATLRRAAISGRVEVDGAIVDHFADVLDGEGSIVSTVALDAKSYGSLKNRWMRCKTEQCA